MSDRYLVTGAAGFIGASLVARLKSQGHWVRAVDIKTTPERSHLYEQADEFMLVDLRKPGMESTLADVDYVYHLAADHGGAGYFHGDWDFKAAENNLRIDQNVRREAMAQGVKRLFFAGSACTYPVAIQGEDAAPLREADFGGGPAEACYGEAKRMSTIMFDSAREHGHDFRVGIFSTIYGPTQDTEEPRAKFPTAICRKVLDGLESYLDLAAQGHEPDPPKVEIWGDGTQVRTFLYIEDALDRIQTVLDSDHYEGPVNVGSDEAVTVQQCADWVADSAGIEPEWVYTDGPVGVAHRAADNTEWNARYGEGDLTPAHEGFDSLYRWMADQR